MNRKWYSVLLCVGLMAFSQAQAEGTLNIVATTEHYGAIAKIVGADRVTVSSLASGDQDPRVLEPKRSFTALCNKADLLIVNGQGLEAAWLPALLSDSVNSRIIEGKPGYLDASRGVALLPYEPDELERPLLFNVMVGLSALFGGSRREAELANNRYYWLDPANGEVIARAISERLALLDPPNAAFYQANYARFAARLQDKLQAWDAMMQPFTGTEMVSFRRSWTYLARRHGIKISGYIEPREPLVFGTTTMMYRPGGDEIAFLVAHMQQQRIKLIVSETYQDRGMAQQIATRAGAQLLLLPSAVSQRQGIDDYFQLFDHIYAQLVKALQGAGV
jgi:zinc/manganese transport system substrate-binding protein